ncbi:hypothetical protein C5167_015777 [Papaver somniferum]|uniref:SWIM-type domain-containing protein n=1 Tax=Papaver somniferum TaxID=3469 RepID=A0A4Y7J718_PAPSO|nr:hypothetical protein C5167_015777 [Papaver somniferum]
MHLSFPKLGVFQCKKFHREHACNLASSDPAKFRMTKSFLKDILMDEFRASNKKKIAADVQDLLHLEYGIDLAYSQEYHGLQFTKESLWGDDIKSIVHFEYDGVTKQFQRFFVAFEASITEIYLVVFGIVPCENCESLEWFLTNLKGIISEDRPLTIISNRGSSLLKHVHMIFPKDHHSYCLYHMKGNIPVPKGKSRQTAGKLFEECYTALTNEKFYAPAKSMSNLKLDSVIDWMVKISFRNWDAYAFLGERFGEDTLNIAENFNSVIKHDKRFPSLEIIDCIRAKVMENNYKRLVEFCKWIAKHTPRMQARLNKRFRRSNDKVFEIISPTGKHTVDLDAKTCTCNWWQKHSFPCTHSMKVMLHIEPDEPYKYIILYYTTDYYRGLHAHPIYPITDSERPPKISEMVMYCLPRRPSFSWKDNYFKVGFSRESSREKEVWTVWETCLPQPS